MKYYTKMLGLWQDLDLNCEEEWECMSDSVRFKKKMENEKVFKFLAGMNRELDDVRGRVLNRQPLPSIREVFSEVRREERRRKVMLREHLTSGPEASTLVTRGPHARSGGPHAGSAQDSLRGLIVSIVRKRATLKPLVGLQAHRLEAQTAQ